MTIGHHTFNIFIIKWNSFYYDFEIFLNASTIIDISFKNRIENNFQWYITGDHGRAFNNFIS